MNPPNLLPFAAFGGDWPAYEAELHRIFVAEIANGGVQYDWASRRLPSPSGSGAPMGVVLASGTGR